MFLKNLGKQHPIIDRSKGMSGIVCKKCRIEPTNSKIQKKVCSCKRPLNNYMSTDL
jgi:hypothetical protein